jgi:AcrR family transcriptional regulator
MGRPRTLSDEALLSAAREVFLEEGPHVPVARIAERLGVTHASVFERVGSKEKLLIEALAPERPRAMGAFAEAPPRDAAREKLVTMLVELMQFFRRVVPGLVVLKTAGHAPFERARRGELPPPIALRRALAAWLERAVEIGALRHVDCDVVAEGLLGAMEARVFNAYLGGRSFAPRRDEAFVERLVFGLVGRTS